MTTREVPYSITEIDGNKVITLMTDPKGKPVSIAENDPAFNEMSMALLQKDWDAVHDIANSGVAGSINKKLAKASDRIYVNGSSVYVDGKPIDFGDLTETVIKMTHAGDEGVKALVNFIERMITNPSTDSIEQLYDWIKRHGMTITSDGHFIAYKGVDRNNRESWQKSGGAYVDGEWKKPVINPDGAIIMMPRDDVDAGPSHCSTGLHVATHSFAKTFTSGPTLRVLVNPANVVAVPNDRNFQKIRVCEYIVIDACDDEVIEPVVNYEPKKDKESVLDYSKRVKDELKKLVADRVSKAD